MALHHLAIAALVLAAALADGDCALATSFTVEPLTGTLGAIVHGVNLSAPLDALTVGQLKDSLGIFRVLFFRDQNVTPTQHVAFTRNFGSLTPAHPLLGGLDADHPYAAAQLPLF